MSLIRDEAGQVHYNVIVCEDITEQKQAEQALRESEQRYHSMFDNNHAVMLLIDPQTADIVDANPAAAAFYGYSLEELRAKEISDINTLPREQIFAAMQQAREQHQRVFTFQHRLATGEIRDVEVYSGPIEAHGKRLLYSIIHDVTERRRAELALRESEERFRELAENIHEVFWLFDWEEQRVVYASPAYEVIWGRSISDLYARYETWGDNLHPEDRPFAEQSFKQIVATGGGEPREYRIIRSDGEVRWISDRGFAIYDESGQVRRIAGIAEDITARKQAEEELKRYKDHLEQLVAERTAALQESEEKFRTIFEGAPLGIGLGDREGRILAVNPAVSRITGFSPEEMRLVGHLEIIQPEDRPAYERLRQELWEGKRDSYEAEFRFWRKDGTQGWGRMQATLLRTGETEPQIALAMFEDITRQKETEAEIETYQERLRALASDLSLTEERERRHLASFLHDDVVQLLALAKIKLWDLRQEVSAGSPAQAADEIQDFLNRAIERTRNLTFELSLPILYEMGLEEALEWLAEQFQREHGLLVKVRRDEQPKPLAEGPRVLLFRLVRELLTNVVKHAQAREAEISLARQDGNLHIHLQDDGVGFEVEKITKPGGAGFGLFSIRERLSHLGGRLEISSAPGQGTRISITVPLAAPDTSSPPV